MNAVEPTAPLQTLAEVRELCPDMRLGQLAATIGLRAEDATDHSLWDIEDYELLAAMQRFREDLLARAR